MSNLKGKVAVVTGASKGIGAGIAKALGAAGASVVVNYASDRQGAEKAVADIKAKGGKAVAVKGDVSKLEDVKHLVDETRKTFGKVDVLVNNAACSNSRLWRKPRKRNTSASSASMCWDRCRPRARPCPCSGRKAAA
jgi:NAD(P)-dependent dehydrogenase (short-subunit alcohol dehydrogenase family)